MPKKLSSLVDNVDAILKEMRVNVDALTLTLMVYTHDAAGTRTINLRLSAKEVLEAAAEINKRLGKIKRLEKRIETLEKKECKCHK